MYLYGSMVTEDVADWKIAASNVTLGDKLPNAKGRFADIHSATLRSKGGRQEVVAKTLKRTYSSNCFLFFKPLALLYCTAPVIVSRPCALFLIATFWREKMQIFGRVQR